MVFKSFKIFILVNFFSEFLNDLKCYLIMGEKMFFMVFLLKDLILMILKCLRNLGVILFLLFFGGFMVEIIIMFISFSIFVFFLSN